MAGSVGIVAKLLETLVSKFLDEDQIPELLKRRKLATKKEECRRALIDNRFVDLARLTGELRDMADQP